MSPSTPSPMRILVAEPDTVIAGDLCRRLERFGFTVAGTVHTAGELARFTADFDVLLSEAVLADGADGIAPAARLAAERNAPLVFLTTVPDEDTVRRMIGTRPRAILLKPLKERELFTTLGLAAFSRYSSLFDLPCGLEPGGEGILIIEDEKIIALDEQRHLERAGYNVVGLAPSAEEGIDLARKLRPALVTTGINLAGTKMDGIEGAAAIRNFLDIPIIYITAYSDEPTLERVWETRPEAYILKPLKGRELPLTLRLAFAKYEGKVRPLDPAGIFAAARRGTPADLEAALAGLPSPDVRDPGGRTPLMYAAARSRDPDTVRTLLRAGSDPDAADSHGRTALFYAIAGGTPEILKTLLALGADRSRRDADGFSALDLELSRWKRPAWVSVFLAAGEDPNQVGPDGRSLADRLLESKQRGSWDEMASLLILLNAGIVVDRTRFEEIQAREIWRYTEAVPTWLPFLLALGVEIDRRDEADRTALHWTAIQGTPDAMAAILAAGASPEARDKDGSTPLMLRAERCGDDDKALRILLDSGSSLESRDQKGRTALMRACAHANLMTCAILLERGADPNARDEDGRTAMMLCAATGYGDEGRSVLKLLLEHGARHDSRDMKGHTPLFHAYFKYNLGAVETLLECGADPNAADSEGRTPLALFWRMGTTSPGIFRTSSPIIQALLKAGSRADLASLGAPSPAGLYLFAAADPRVFRNLIAEGADVSITDDRKWTALRFAVQEFAPEKECLDTLLDSGADPAIRDVEGKSPYDIAKVCPRPPESTTLERLRAAAEEADAENPPR